MTFILDRINALLKSVGGTPIEPATSRHHNLHRELDTIDRQLGIVTRHTYRRPSSVPLMDSRSNVGERVRRLEAAVVQRRVAAEFNHFVHLGREAEAA